MNGRGVRCRFALSLAVLVAVSTGGSALASGKPTYAHKMEVGQLLYFNGDIERAIKAFEAAGELNPKAFEPHLNLVNLYVQKGGDDALVKAADECREVLSRKPNNKDAHLILGNLLRTQAGTEQDPEKQKSILADALKEIAAAEDCGAPKPLCEYTIGTLLLQKGEFADSLKHIDEAIDAQPTFADAHLIRAVLLFRLMSNNLPKNEDGTVKPLDVNNPDVQKNIADIEKELDLAIKQKPKNAEAHNTKAEIAMSLSRYDDALKEYQQMTDDDPKNLQAWMGIGTVEATVAMKESDTEKQRPHYERARDAFQKAQQIKPDDRTINQALAAMYIRLGQAVEAVQQLQKQMMLETNPMQRAQLAMQIQQLQGAAGLGSSLGGSIGGFTAGPVGVGNNLFTSGALSVPMKDLIKIKPPKEKKED
jgi:tetratricopeptide (TPR) repeat protein